ncbi:hypothetical protein ACFYKX_10765 [Cytobacillus sp. FJAT-54145]|uniref:Uncharacterized protein n=1 Tax=Cytobacillus spartinae TaxID=3299023 RepID=A0ABW6KA30_9BACI
MPKTNLTPYVTFVENQKDVLRLSWNKQSKGWQITAPDVKEAKFLCHEFLQTIEIMAMLFKELEEREYDLTTLQLTVKKEKPKRHRLLDWSDTLGVVWGKDSDGCGPDWIVCYPRRPDGWLIHSDLVQTDVFNRFIKGLPALGYEPNSLRFSIKRKAKP